MQILYCSRMMIFLYLGLLLVVSPTATAPASENEATQKSNFDAVHFMAIVETILEHHIVPPTRQQMVLDGVKALYAAHGQPIPARLSKEISELASLEALTDYLLTLPVQFNEDVKPTVLQGMFENVPGVPRLIDAEEARVQESLQANRYVGIGIALTMTADVPQISSVMHGGPGYPAGVKAEDFILEIDGQPTTGKDLGSVVQELRGDEGTAVSLLLQQPNDSARPITVVRGVTFIPTIEGLNEVSPGQWNYFADRESKIAVLRIKQFGPSTVHELKKIESQLRSENATGIVLDLREGGGRLHDVVLFADQLLDDGAIGEVQTLDSNSIHQAQPGSLFQRIPIAALVDVHSGPDRVFLAAALQDSKRAKIVGRVPITQEMFVRGYVDLADGERMLLATGLLKRGDGNILQRPSQRERSLLTSPVVALAPGKHEGPTRSIVIPDLVVPYPANPDGIEGRDAVVEMAVRMLADKTIEVNPTPQDASESS